MKTTALTLLIGFLTFSVWAQPANTQTNASDGVKIKVVIDNVPSDQGHVLISLHTQDTFMKGGGIQSQSSAIVDGKVEFTFSGVADGTYAIMALHDANDNQQMDYADNGMPTESWGMSGDALVMGPPSFDAAQFEVDGEDLSLTIRF